MTGARSNDSVYRQGLHAVRCDACRRPVAHGEDRVIMQATWRGYREHVCRDCWALVMESAAIALIRLSHQQADLPF